MNKKNLEKQVGGEWYKTMTIQPIEYIQANRMEFAEGCVIKYVSRHKKKKRKRGYTKSHTKPRVYIGERLQ